MPKLMIVIVLLQMQPPPSLRHLPPQHLIIEQAIDRRCCGQLGASR